jgi:hypothetical protein
MTNTNFIVTEMYWDAVLRLIKTVTSTGRYLSLSCACLLYGSQRQAK